MKEEIQNGVSFRGEVSYESGSCHDVHRFDINMAIEAETIEEAISKAKEVIEKCHQKYKNKEEF